MKRCLCITLGALVLSVAVVGCGEEKKKNTPVQSGGGQPNPSIDNSKVPKGAPQGPKAVD